MNGPKLKPQHGWLWHGCIAIIGIVASYLLSTPGTSRGEAIERMSAMLQFGGLVVVAVGIRELRREFGFPTWWSELKSEVKETVARLTGRKQPQVVMPLPGKMEWKGFPARLRVRPAPDATVKQRLDYFQTQIEHIQDVADTLDEHINSERDARTAAIVAVKADIETRYSELWGRIRNISAGGIRLESVGLIWLTVGTLLPGFDRFFFWLWRSV